MKTFTLIIFSLLSFQLLAGSAGVKHDDCTLYWTDHSTASTDDYLDQKVRTVLEKKGYIISYEGETYQTEEDLSSWTPSSVRKGDLWAHKKGPNGGCFVEKRNFWSESYFCTYDLKISIYRGSDALAQNSDKSIAHVLYLNEEFDNPKEFEESLFSDLRRIPFCYTGE